MFICTVHILFVPIYLFCHKEESIWKNYKLKIKNTHVSTYINTPCVLQSYVRMLHIMSVVQVYKNNRGDALTEVMSRQYKILLDNTEVYNRHSLWRKKFSK